MIVRRLMVIGLVPPFTAILIAVAVCLSVTIWITAGCVFLLYVPKFMLFAFTEYAHIHPNIAEPLSWTVAGISLAPAFFIFIYIIARLPAMWQRVKPGDHLSSLMNK